jgi:hypothetical protein
MTLEQFFTPLSGAKPSSVVVAPVTGVVQPAKQHIDRGVDRHAVSPVRVATQPNHLRHPLRGCSLSRGKRAAAKPPLWLCVELSGPSLMRARLHWTIHVWSYAGEPRHSTLGCGAEHVVSVFC